MWCLVDATGKRLYFKPNKSITFGRKKADIVLQNDESISRLHASISVIPEDFIPLDGPTSICKLKDLNSKYGTYILYGEKTMEVTADEYIFKHNDVIRFGLQHHLYTIVSVPIIIVTSTLNVDDKSKLEYLMGEIDGLISEEWTSRCTYLTVSKATLTEKVTCALAAAIPIVTVAYWEQFKVAIDNNEEFPGIKDFVPIISETLVDKQKYLLSPNVKRRTLFQNLIFVHFSTSQYKIYAKIISMAGGKSLLYSKKHLTIKELCAPNIIVLQYPNYNETQSTESILPEYDSIFNALQANECKMISDSEIPLSILHCSVEKYCNPKYKFSKLLKRSQPKYHPSKILNLDTQDERSDLKILPKIISSIQLKSGHTNVKHSVLTTKIIPETCDNFDSQALALLDKDSIEQSMEEPKCNNLRIIEETKDTFTDVLTVEESEEIMQPIGNTNCIPETVDSSYSDMSPKSNQCFTHNIENLKTQQNRNTQDTEHTKKLVISKETLLHKVTELDKNEDFELQNPGLNDNENHNKVVSQRKSSNLVEINDLQDEDVDQQMMNLSIEHNLQTAMNNNQDCSITDSSISETLEEPQESKRTRRYFSDDSDTEFLTSTKKKICLKNSDIENTTKLQPSTFNSCIEEQKSSNTLLGYNSSFLRNILNCKNFKKVYNITPTRRIGLKEMYVWNSDT
ncbi:PREDICTED: nibrin [Eufriesea mexicana]|uniref:nibrin n=1 Tax=Eufriesea mexicana TaxID=516756 RepID=UPI00083C1FB7|nr:PREDICTED: nibrin [Eufriesea mexicana]